MSKVLLIDDEADFRAPIIEFLKMDGFDTIEAGNGRDGVEIAIREKPDVIVCDIMMPSLNGYEVLSKLRDYDEFRQIPFIFLSAKTASRDIRTGMNLGADDYMTKPVYLIDLVNAIHAQLEKSLKRREVFEKKDEEMRNDIALMLLCPSKTTGGKTKKDADR